MNVLALRTEYFKYVPSYTTGIDKEFTHHFTADLIEIYGFALPLTK